MERSKDYHQQLWHPLFGNQDLWNDKVVQWRTQNWIWLEESNQQEGIWLESLVTSVTEYETDYETSFGTNMVDGVDL